MNIRNAREYMERLLWIRTKEGAEVRLELKPAQEKLYRVVREQVRSGKPVRIIILKARQMGFSTEVSGLIFHACATQENRAALLVAHVAEATNNLHQMHLRFYDRLPAPLRPLRAASNAIELRFANPSKDPEERAREPGLRSRIRCATAGGKGVGRSDTLQYVHVSEYAFWPDGINTKQDTLLGILQAVPDLPGTMVFIESTAKGYDDFHKRWEDAVAGRSEFVPVFFSWAEEPGYRRPVPPGTVWSEEERTLMERYGLEPEQMAWRRWCIANNCNGDLDRFHQEYPLTPEEAFIASGACWFELAVLTKRLEELESWGGVGNGERAAYDRPYTATNGRRYGEDGGERAAGERTDMATNGRRYGEDSGERAADDRPYRRDDGDGGEPLRGCFVYEVVWDQAAKRKTLVNIEFRAKENGPVTIWRKPEKGVPYVLGGDTAGEGSDYFSAYVIDNTTAAMCARIYLDNGEAYYTEQVYCLGQYFNNALIGLEINFSTYPTRCLQEWGYPRLYVRETEDSYTHSPRKSFGWRTDPITRPAMLSELRQIVEAHPELILDPQLIREMMVFVKDKTGRPAALEGEHDDLVMGYGITLKIRDQQAAVREITPGRKGRYTEDMLEDWRKAKPQERALLEQMWGRPY